MRRLATTARKAADGTREQSSRFDPLFGRGRFFGLLPLVLVIIGAGCQGPWAKTSGTHVHSPPSPESLHAQALSLTDDPEQAAHLLAEARRLDPASGEIALDRGALLLELCRYGEAEAELREASLLLPASPWPHYNLGWLHQEIGDYENATLDYEAALVLAPAESEILDNLLLVYTRLGTEPKRRLELIDRALLASPDPNWQRWLRLQRALLSGVATRDAGSREANSTSATSTSEPDTH